MILARIVGTVVSTRKDPRLDGKKLLVVKPISPEGADESGYLIAVDSGGRRRRRNGSGRLRKFRANGRRV